MLQNRAITQVKVQWRHFSPEEATWEMEEAMRKSYPFLFQGWELDGNTEDDVQFKGGKM
jgi:hypothetical protein